MSKKRPLIPPDARQTQVCPLCGATQPVNQRRCPICGATLAGKAAPLLEKDEAVKSGGPSSAPRFDPARGDDDLYIGDLRGRMWRVLVVVGIVLALGGGAVTGWWLGRDERDKGGSPDVQIDVLGTATPGDGAAMGTPGETGLGAAGGTPTAPPTSTPRNLWPTASPTYTPMMTPLPFATITPVPPTATETPTPGPCYQTAGPGDTVYAMAVRCGHRDLAIVDVILELNGMKSAVELQINQTLEIPWPTPTPGGDSGQSSVPGADVTVADTGANVALNQFGTPDVLQAFANFEPTLRPGLAWHSVQPGETILSIAWDYGATLKVLSELNPEVPFLQCDFGSASGGENCSVMLYEGQRIRVPVPLPTNTPIPTPAGTLTPPPTATATFNAPYLIAPKDGTHFFADQQVTLRWGGSGTLGEDEWYLVRVRDLTNGANYLAPVKSTTYILPGGWQPADRSRHSMEWTISVARLSPQFEVLSEQYITEPSLFTWDSR